MTPHEATIKNIKALKGQPLKEKLHYIFTNFRAPILAALFVVVMLTSLVIHWATQKPTVLRLCCVNTAATQTDTDSYLQRFAQAEAIDTNKNSLTARHMRFGGSESGNFENFQVFTTMYMAGDLDVAIIDNKNLIHFAYQDCFFDLTEVLTPEQLSALAPYLVYIDLSFQEQLDILAEDTPVYPDAFQPEAMERPVPVAISLQPEWALTQCCFPSTYQGSAIALFSSSLHTEQAEAFLQFVLTDIGT